MQRLGSYELIRRLGSGGMAEVWMGRRVAGEGIFKAVAIKVVASQRADDERYRRMFLDEARLSMLLGHSNIVQVFDVGVHEGTSFLAMEWIDGLNLAQLSNLARVRQLPIPDSVAAHVIGELLSGLAYAHTVTHEGRSLSIIHRDVSPQNVLISVSGEVKLADFGIARIAHDETSGLYVKGKLRYMAPEQLAGVSRAPTVDLYAVGAILHELLDGVRFREAEDEAAIIAQIHSGVIPPLNRRNVPPELDRLRRSLLEPKPERRVQSAIAAIELLRLWPGYRNETLVVGRLCRLCLGIAAPRTGVAEDPAADASSTPAVISASTARDTDPPPPRPVPERGRSLPWVAVAGAALLTGALAYGLAPRRDAEAPTSASERAGEGRPFKSAEFSLPTASSPAAVGNPGAASAAEDPPTSAAAAEGTGPAAASSGAATGSGGTSTRSTGSAGSAGVGGSSGGTHSTHSTSSASSTSTSSTRPAPTPGAVTFKALSRDGLDFLYLRVNGPGGAQEFTAESIATRQLAPGMYTVEYRFDRRQAWRGAGQIEVEPGADHEARMVKVGEDVRIVYGRR
ncbi:MAG: serine/threonine-protein kinase [Nannocystaceae bacterium]